MINGGGCAGETELFYVLVYTVEESWKARPSVARRSRCLAENQQAEKGLLISVAAGVTTNAASSTRRQSGMATIDFNLNGRVWRNVNPLVRIRLDKPRAIASGSWHHRVASGVTGTRSRRKPWIRSSGKMLSIACA